MHCRTCKYLTCHRCFDKYQEHDDARNKQLMCNCREKLQRLETIKGNFTKEQVQRSKMRLGLFVLLLDDRDNAPDFSFLYFKCTFHKEGCPEVLSYEQMIND